MRSFSKEAIFDAELIAAALDEVVSSPSTKLCAADSAPHAGSPLS